jgi:hypothetical protein
MFDLLNPITALGCQEHDTNKNGPSTPRRKWRPGWTGYFNATMATPLRWTKRKPLVAEMPRRVRIFGGMLQLRRTAFSRLSVAGISPGQAEGIFWR